MALDWRRAESRTVRPFTGVDSCLDGVKMRVTPDEIFDDETRFSLDKINMETFRPELELNFDHTFLATGPYASDTLEFVVQVSDRGLKRSKIVFRSNPSSLPAVWSIPDSEMRQFSWSSGAEISVALVLRKSGAFVPGRPFIMGHWVARKNFTIAGKPAISSFPIERWTAREFKAEGLPGDTPFLIQFKSLDFYVRMENPAEYLAVCIREDVYDSLAENEERGIAKAFASLLCAEVMAGIVSSSLSKMKPEDDYEKGSPLDNVLSRIRKSTGFTRQQLEELVAREELTKVKSIALASCGVRKALLKSNKG